MCDFCKPDDIFDSDEVTRKIAAESVDMGNITGMFDLEAWLMIDELSKNPKLQVCLSTEDLTGDIASVDIPIKYCPKCGRKL